MGLVPPEKLYLAAEPLTIPLVMRDIIIIMDRLRLSLKNIKKSRTLQQFVKKVDGWLWIPPLGLDSFVPADMATRLSHDELDVRVVMQLTRDARGRHNRIV